MPKERQNQPQMPYTRRSAQFTTEESMALDGAAAALGEHPGDFIRRVVNAEIKRLQTDASTVNRARETRRVLQAEEAVLSRQLEGISVFLKEANPVYPKIETSPLKTNTEK
jgi:hypothetical protein